MTDHDRQLADALAKAVRELAERIKPKPKPETKDS